MSRFFRAKKKFVSLAGGSGAGRKIIKANLGDDGVVVLRLLKTATVKLHGKKRAKQLKKNLLRLAVKCGYLFKNEILTDADVEGLKDPFERLCKQFMDATEADADVIGSGDGGGGGESKYGTVVPAAEAGSDDEDDDDDDDDDVAEGEGESEVTAPGTSTASADETLRALPPAVRAHVENLSKTIAGLDACLTRMLTPHMKAKNINKLTSTVQAYANPVWLAFFLHDDQCQGERVSAHSVFHNWYDRNFREAAERRAERAAQQRQFSIDRSGFSAQTFLSNPRKQSYLAMYLKEAHGDRTSCQLWQAVEKLKSVTNRNLVESRAQLLHTKFMSEPGRKRLHVTLPVDFVSAVDAAVAAGKCTKNMFDAAQEQVVSYLQGALFESFLLSRPFEAFVRAAYHVRIDGTPMSEEEEAGVGTAATGSSDGGASKEANRRDRRK